MFQRKLFFILPIIWMCLSNCQPLFPTPYPTPTDPGFQFTRQALDRTQSALETRQAQLDIPIRLLTEQAAVPTSTPTFKPLPTSSATPTPETPCDRIEYVRDVNLPSGSGLPIDTEFVKKWVVRNSGNCVWNEDYALVYYGGELFSADEVIPLRRIVNPGESVDILIFMRTPKKIGNYRGYWRLRNSRNQILKIDNLQIGSLAVDIRAGIPNLVVLDFVNSMCTAPWSNSLGGLPCPGKDGDKRGYVQKRDDPEVENSRPEDKPSLLTVPEYFADGMIQGKYPVFTPQFGDRFRAEFGCQKNAVGCEVIYQVNAQRSDGSFENLANWHEVYDNNSVDVNLDLSFLAGEPVQFILVAYAYGNPEGDRPLWVRPRIEGFR